MNKDYFIINAADQMDANKLRFIRSWLRHFFKQNEVYTSLEVYYAFHEFVFNMYVKDIYEIFHEPERFRFVQMVSHYIDSEGKQFPLYSLHDDMYSTMIKRNKTLKTEAHGVGETY